MHRLLITSMGSTAAQNLAGFLRERALARFWVLGSDVRAEHGGLGLCNADATLPAGTDARYAATVVALCERHGVSAVLPVMEDELLALHAVRDQLAAAGLRALLSDAAGIEATTSKRAWVRALQHLGLSHPQLYAGRHDAVLPAFAKPDRGTGSRGAVRIDSEAALDAAFAHPETTLVMAFCEGVELSVDAFADAGQLVHAIARTRDEVRGGLVVRSTVVELTHELWSASLSVARYLGLHGFFNLQCIRDGSGQYHFTDLNARLGGGMALSFQAGLAADRYLDAWMTGAPQQVGGETVIGLRLYRRWHNVIVDPGPR